MSRPNWHSYFMAIAQTVAQRATCPRASVGAVIVKDNRILATGYNGALADEPHCTEVGCSIEGEHCQRAVHAEVNAVAHAARYGVALDGAIIFVWDSMSRQAVCPHCRQVTQAAGIRARFIGGPSVR